MSSTPLTFSQFQQFLAEVLSADATELLPERSFLDDLGIDSLKLVDMILAFELELGVQVPTEAAWEMQTVGAAYAGYLSLVDGNHGEAGQGG